MAEVHGLVRAVETAEMKLQQRGSDKSDVNEATVARVARSFVDVGR